MKHFMTLLFMLMLLLGIVVSVQAGEQILTQNQISETYKVFANPGTLNPEMPGVSLLADYDSFQLFSVSSLQYESISDSHSAIFSVMDTDEISINGHKLETTQESPFASQYHISGKSLQIIQFVGPIKDEWLAEIKEAGIEPIHYIANNGYLVWADDNGRSQLNTLQSQNAYLQFNTHLSPNMKLSPDLAAEIEGAQETAVIPVAIQMIQHDEQDVSKAIIEELLVTKQSQWEPILKFQTIYGQIKLSDLATISQLPDVYWLGLQQPMMIMDEVQGQILAGHIITTSAYSAIPSGPGYLNWLDSYGFSNDPADYPIVDITDDGIGNGNANNAAGDQTFRELGQTNTNSRIAYIQSCTSENDGSGIGGHGHINLSIAGGYDTRTGFPYQDDDDYQLGLGINPYGRFGGTRVFYFDYSSFPLGATIWDNDGCGGSYQGIIQANQDSGAKISNNSWGNTTTSYGPSAQAYDVGVRDADLNEAGNQELTYIFSAGNAGRANSIGNPATAKNIITVGASENYRPYDIDSCNKGPTDADDVMDIAAFSSQGPAIGNRIKPEIVAPGSHVQGTASTNPFFNGNTVCGAEDNDRFFPANDAFYPLNQSVFTWSSGTSHAAPAVAGIASLYYYWLENHYQIESPSPAMIKAYLLTHTLYLTGARANDTLPSNRQGYGLPDMNVALDNTPRVFMDQQIMFGSSGENWTKEIKIADPSKPVRILLAYTDAAGIVSSSNPQVNDLNLQVESASDTYFGNHFQWQWSEPGGSPDTNNNYEAVYLPPGESGNLNITVTAFNIAGDGVPNNLDETDQDFAFVCYNCIELLQISPSHQSVCTTANSTTFTVTAVPAQGSEEELVMYNASNLPTGTSASFNPNPVALPQSSTLTITGLNTATAGNYMITVNGVSTELERSSEAGLELLAQSPGIPTLTSPPDDANVPNQTITLVWEEVNGGTTYSVEIATDNAFANIIASESDLTDTYYQISGLLPSAKYYWRVNSSNSCGTGQFSEAFSFSIQDKIYLPIILND